VLRTGVLFSDRSRRAYVGPATGATSLAAFHTLFIAAGALLFLPLAPRFGQLVERILPDRGDSITQRLDHSLLAIPAVALEASQRALEQLAERLFDFYGNLLSLGASASQGGGLAQAGHSLERTYDFVSRIQLRPATPAGPQPSPAHSIIPLRFHSRLHDLASQYFPMRLPWQSRTAGNLALGRPSQKNLALPDSWNSMRDPAAMSPRAHNCCRHAAPSASPRSPAQDRAYRCWNARPHIWRICHIFRRGAHQRQEPARQENPS